MLDYDALILRRIHDFWFACRKAGIDWDCVSNYSKQHLLQICGCFSMDFIKAFKTCKVRTKFLTFKYLIIRQLNWYEAMKRRKDLTNNDGYGPCWNSTCYLNPKILRLHCFRMALKSKHNKDLINYLYSCRYVYLSSRACKPNWKILQALDII